jgi:hypothetical protein
MQKVIIIIFCWVMCCHLSAQPNITAAEYFFDTDPGFGNGTNIPLTPGTDVQNINFTPNISSLTTGVHHLFIRSRNANGVWGVTNRFAFYKPTFTAAFPPVNVMKAEYFFDTDPGFGNGTDIPITPGTDVQNINFTPTITSLSEGVHHLFIRSRNSNGSWGITNRFVLYKPNPAAGLPPAVITHVEYFIDNDPGFGNAIPVAINPAADIADFVMPVNISGLSVGDHKFFIRSRSSSGRSVTNEYTFPIASTAPVPVINVNAITKTVMCARDSVKISYHPTGTYNPGNVFNAELSDASGSFASPVIIGSYTGTNSVILASRIPPLTAGGTNYRVRVSSTNPVVTGLTGANLLTIGNWPYLGIDTTVYHSCPNQTTNLNNLYNTTGLTALWNTGNTTTAPPGNYTLIVTNSFNCTDTASANIVLEVATWTGTTSSDWHTASNWNIGKVPGDKTHVIVPGGTPNSCIVSNANASAASVQVRNATNVQVINNRILTIIENCVTLPSN